MPLAFRHSSGITELQLASGVGQASACAELQLGWTAKSNPAPTLISSCPGPSGVQAAERRSGSVVGQASACAKPPQLASGSGVGQASACAELQLGSSALPGSAICRTALLLLSILPALAQPVLPDGPGKAETEKICRGCHEVARSVSLRQDRAAWAATVTKMASLGMKATEKELEAVTDYLAKNYPADAVPPVNVNKAQAIEFESRLGLRRSQAAAIIRYRTEHGDFKSLADLEKVPGLDAALLDSKKDRLVF